jgi:3-hydroxypropanoate dehydrogenase
MFPLNEEALNTILLKARTHTAWLDIPVPNELLKQIYDLAKLGPTSANTSPQRIVFVRSQAEKERLKPALSPGNVDKTMAAPVCAILAYDLRFYEYLPKLFPHNPAMKDNFTAPGKEEIVKTHAFRNATLEGGYFIMAARAVGLDTGPMSGFDNAKVDAAFFPDGRYKSNFLCNLGYGDSSNLYPRNPRLSFEEACRIV